MRNEIATISNLQMLKLTLNLPGVINKRKQTLTYPSSFKINGNCLTDRVSIASIFCKYFSSIGHNLASKIAPTAQTIMII